MGKRQLEAKRRLEAGEARETGDLADKKDGGGDITEGREEKGEEVDQEAEDKTSKMTVNLGKKTPS